MKEKLTAAFRELRKRGYFARKNWQCCQNCGWSMIPDDKAKKAVFYHKQDAEDLDQNRGVHLAWSGDGAEIVSVLEGAGLTVEWNGSERARIHVVSAACEGCKTAHHQ